MAVLALHSRQQQEDGDGGSYSKIASSSMQQTPNPTYFLRGFHSFSDIMVCVWFYLSLEAFYNNRGSP